MRVTCSMTIRGSPPTMPCTSNRTAPWVPASNSPMVLVLTVASSGRRSRVSRISSSSTPSARAISRTCPPHTMVGHGRREHRRLVVHRLAHADQVADRVLLVVGGVVEDLLAADHVDGGAEPADQQRQHVVAPAGVDAGDEQRAAALRDGGQHRLPQLRRGVALVVERVQRGRDDHGAGPDGPDDVGEGLVGRGCRRTPRTRRPAGRRPARRRRRRSRRRPAPRPSPARSPASRPTLPGSWTTTCGELSAGWASTARMAARPTFPVPQTTVEIMGRRVARKLTTRQKSRRSATFAAMDVYEALYTTRAMRRVRPDPIPEAVQARILDAAVRAPSGGNAQGWRFLLVDDPDVRARLGADLPRLRRPAVDRLLREADRRRRGRPRQRGEPAVPADQVVGRPPGRPLRRGAAAPVRLRPARPDRRVDLPGDLVGPAGGPGRGRRVVAHLGAAVPPAGGAVVARGAGRRGLAHGVLRDVRLPHRPLGRGRPPPRPRGRPTATAGVPRPASGSTSRCGRRRADGRRPRRSGTGPAARRRRRQERRRRVVRPLGGSPPRRPT